MEHQALHFDPHSLALCGLQPEEFQLEESERHEKVENNRNSKEMSEEEARIRTELEMEIESDLEAEIKDEIHRLALRLHRLYQHQNYNNNNNNYCMKNQSGQQQIPTQLKLKPNNNKTNKALSEANIISIKNMEGGTKVQIKEINTTNTDHTDKHNNYDYNQKRFDWAKNLRSGPPNPCHTRNRKGTAKEHPQTPKPSKFPQLAWK